MPLVLFALTLAAFAIGNIWGCKLADRQGSVPAFKTIFLALAVALFAMTFTAPHPWLMALTVLAWGGAWIVNHLGLAHAPWIAALVTLAAFGLMVLSGRLDQRVTVLQAAQA